MTEIILWVALAHLLYDFHWQGDFVGTMKGTSYFILFIHALTYALVISLPLFYFNILTVPAFFILLISHFIIDGVKARNTAGIEDPLFIEKIIIDQLLHIIILIVILLV